MSAPYVARKLTNHVAKKMEIIQGESLGCTYIKKDMMYGVMMPNYRALSRAAPQQNLINDGDYMTEKTTQQPLGVASDLNAELGTLLQYKPTDYDPFDGDFGECGDKIFSDKMVKGRKEYTCGHCKGAIAKGQIHRSLNAKFYGELTIYRWCADCCTAMVRELEIRDTEFEFEEEEFPFESRLDLFEPRSA